MKPQTGDILKRQMVAVPFLHHYGIYVELNGQPFVLHIQSDRGTVIDTLDEFLKGYPLRKVLPSEMSGLPSSEILQRYGAATEEEFHIMFNNCERFAHRYTNTPYLGQEIKRAITAFAFFVGIVASVAVILNITRQQSYQGKP